MTVNLRELGLGQGIYAVGEAAVLTGIAPRRIRRWFEGYTYGPHDDRRQSPPVTAGDYSQDGRVGQLSFLDLIEVRFIDAFLRHGVGWKELRASSRRAAQLLGASHPFSSFKFRTDGRRIFAQIETTARDPQLIQMRDSQHVFREVMNPLLLGLEFDAEIVKRWWPLGTKRRVVIDPNRSFGLPVGSVSGVPALVLAQFATANGVGAAARWYEAEKREVKDAIAYAERIAA